MLLTTPARHVPLHTCNTELLAGISSRPLCGAVELHTAEARAPERCGCAVDAVVERHITHGGFAYLYQSDGEGRCGGAAGGELWLACLGDVDAGGGVAGLVARVGCWECCRGVLVLWLGRGGCSADMTAREH